MILEFGAKNFYSFKDWVSISFKLNQLCPTNVSRGEEYTKILGVKGANASGKTNVLKALGFLSYFCTNSFDSKPDKRIAIESFFDTPDPIELYVEFVIDQIVYRYEIELTAEEVLRETIFRTKQRESKVIERVKSRITKSASEFKGLKVVKIRKNASLVSTAHQYQISELEDFYNFFKTIDANVHMFGLMSSPDDANNMSSFLHENEDYFSFVEKLLIKYDPDIKSIGIHSRTLDDGTEHFFPIFNYGIAIKDPFLTFHEQSSGNKALYFQLASYWYVLKHGGLLVLDEFDVYLHPDILPDLLSLFMDEDTNTNHAQLIFTTHNTSILDYLGKYRSYLVNKENCESYAYRLDEIPGDILRNDRSIAKVYRSGKIGGVPKL